MNYSFLWKYILIVLIWGTTWFAITLQLGVVSIELSVAYRFLIAGLCFLAWARIRGDKFDFVKHNVGTIIGQSLFMYGLNYVLIYQSSKFLPSGIVAIIFSTMSVMITLNMWLFFSQPINRATVVGNLIGVLGLCIVFQTDDIIKDTASFSLLGGALFALGSNYAAAWGNIFAGFNIQKKLPMIALNGVAMTGSAFAILIIQWLRGDVFYFKLQPTYILSLLYLALFGTVITFKFYMEVIEKIGPARAGYVAVICPVIALIVSSYFEGLHLNFRTLLGASLVIFGNWWTIRKKITPSK